MTRDVFIADHVRTPIGRYDGALSSVRPDDLAAIPIRALMARHGAVDWGAVDDVVLGCANQAGEDNRNVARMAALLAGLPVDVSGSAINRLCGSGMDAVGCPSRKLRLPQKSSDSSQLLVGARRPYAYGRPVQWSKLARSDGINGRHRGGPKPRCMHNPFHSRLDPNPFQPAAPPQPPRHLQTEPLRRLGRMASIGRLTTQLSGTSEIGSH